MALTNFQYVTLVAAGGTPIRLADQNGANIPTTGQGSLVFSDGATLTNVTIDGIVHDTPLGLDNGTVDAPSLYFGTADRGLYSRGNGDISFASNGARNASIGVGATELLFQNTSTELKLFSDTNNETVIQGYDSTATTSKQLSLQKYGSNVVVGAALSLTAGGAAGSANLLLTTTLVGLYAGTGAPTVSAARGSIYLRNDNVAGTPGMPYANQDAGTTWQQIVGISATQSLSNKTLVSPVITGSVIGGTTFTGTATIPAITVSGANAATVNPTTDTALAGTLALRDTGAGVNNGGQIIFGASQGFFASIKGLISDGTTNTRGQISFATRTLAADAALTERLNIGEAGNTTITSASSAAFVVGPGGITNPVFQINASTASAAAGLGIVGAVAAGTVAVVVISSGSNANLAIDAKGSGTIALGATSTGAITLTRATTMSAALTYGGVTLSNAVTGTGNMVLSIAPTFTGVPLAPTAAIGNNSTQIATTAYADRAGIAGLIIRQQVFTGSATYTAHASAIYVHTETWGAGGGGGGAAAGSGGFGSGAAGGGAGSYSAIMLTRAAATGQSVTIGAAGTAGTAAGGTGGTGGATSLGSLCVSNGGIGGGGATQSNSTGGAGGGAGTGTITSVGDGGGAGFGSAATVSAPISGKGGTTSVGGGGQGVNGSSSTAGIAGNKGGGGSGAASPNGGSNQAGGAGGAGYCVITEYCTA